MGRDVNESSVLLLLTAFVNVSDLVDFVVVVDAQNLYDRVFVCPKAADGFVQFLGLILDRWCHQSDYDVLKIASQFAFQFLDQVLKYSFRTSIAVLLVNIVGIYLAIHRLEA